MRIFSGTVWRHVPRGASALHAGWILRASGRWNRHGVYGCLYTALTREGALAEYRKYTELARASRRVDARELVSIRVNRIGPVLDLTETANRMEAGVDLSVLTSDNRDELETCRTIADWARSEGYQGLLVPSAALAGHVNLVIYIDGPASNIDLDEGAERIALTQE